MSLHNLEDLLTEYSTLMAGSTGRVMDEGIKYGAVFTEVGPPIDDQQAIDVLQFDPIAKAAFDCARITFEVRSCSLLVH